MIDTLQFAGRSQCRSQGLATFLRGGLLATGLVLASFCVSPIMGNNAHAQSTMTLDAVNSAPSLDAPSRPDPAPSLSPAAEQRIFAQWKLDFEARAIARGADARTTKQVLASLDLLPQVLHQAAEASRWGPIWQRLDPLAHPTRIALAKKKLAQYRTPLEAIERKMGVPSSILVAIWGVETNFGALRGGFDIAATLASRAAFDPQPRWRDFAEDNLLALIEMISNRAARRADLVGSYAGATGQVQFIPRTFLDYALDWNRDGRRDIWNDPVEALASAANYLRASGWKAGEPVALEVLLPNRFDLSLCNGEKRTVRDWAAMGVRRADNRAFRTRDLDLQTELFMPASSEGPIFVTFTNFEVIKVYNQADFYALAVDFIADAAQGYGGLVRPWPRHKALIEQSEARELQEILVELGYKLDIDGRFGRDSRRQLQNFQRDRGLAAQGFPEPGALEDLRAARAQERAKPARQAATTPS